MIDETLSSDMCSLLDSCIDSVEALDALLILQRDPDRRWTAGELAQSLKVDTCVAGLSLASLLSQGLARSHVDGTFQLEELSPLAVAGFADLASAVARNRTATIHHLTHRSRVAWVAPERRARLTG